MIRDAGAGRYEFVRWEVYGEFGATKKCVVRCVIDWFVWITTAYSLVRGGTSCPQCAGQRKWTAKERIEQINSLKNIEFVSWVDGYRGNTSKANVRCSVDNYSWSPTVNNLVNGGQGCSRCAGKRIWTPDERIDQINSLENIEFLSWIGEYKNCYSKANVKCAVDNFVWSAAVNDLVNGMKGCPRCAKYGYQLDKTGYLYALRSECGRYVKVGISNNPSRRHRQLELATPFKFNLIEQISGDGVKIAELEKSFHEKYEGAGFTGFDGATEWLICSDELLTELRSL